jgi:hypothetical protein
LDAAVGHELHFFTEQRLLSGGYAKALNPHLSHFAITLTRLL